MKEERQFCKNCEEFGGAGTGMCINSRTEFYARDEKKPCLWYREKVHYYIGEEGPMTIEEGVNINCSRCEKEMGNGQDCYCQSCMKKGKDDVERYEEREKFMEKEIEGIKIERLKKLIITRNDLNGLYQALCLHQECYEEEAGDWYWAPCKDCILRHIPWPVTGETERDLCFAIWHEDILNQRRES